MLINSHSIEGDSVLWLELMGYKLLYGFHFESFYLFYFYVLYDPFNVFIYVPLKSYLKKQINIHIIQCVNFLIYNYLSKSNPF